MDEYLEALADEMTEVLSGLDVQIARVRTGRATPKLLESVIVTVASYGASMPINELATIKAPDARLLVVTPWDKSTISDVERGIVQAGLGLNPSNDGKLIRVPVPALSSERRAELVRQVKALGEEFKVRLRHIRREYNDTFKTGEKDGEVTEDGLHRLLNVVQDVTNEHITKIDGAVAKKEAELLEV